MAHQGSGRSAEGHLRVVPAAPTRRERAVGDGLRAGPDGRRWALPGADRGGHLHEAVPCHRGRHVLQRQEGSLRRSTAWPQAAATRRPSPSTTGSEFYSKEMDAWAYRRRRATRLHPAGQASGERLHRELQRAAARTSCSMLSYSWTSTMPAGRSRPGGGTTTGTGPTQRFPT